MAVTLQSHVESRRVSGRVAIAVFVAALLIRCGALAVHPPGDDGDQQTYRALAHSLAMGDGFVIDGAPETGVHPCIPALVAMMSLVIKDVRIAAMIVTLLIGAALPAIASWFAGSAFGVRAGIFAGTILALQPHHILASARAEPDLLSAALGFALSAALVSGCFGWAGVAIALGYLNRPEAMVWLPAAVAWAKWRGAGWRAVLVMVFIAATLCAPFVVFIRSVEGRWTLSGKDRWTYANGVHQYRSGNQPLEKDRIPELMRDVESASHHIRTRPREFARGYVYRAWLLIENLGRLTGYGLLVPFAVIGVAGAWRRSRGATLAMLVPLATLPFLPMVATFFRHSLIPAAVVLALAGIGIAAIIDRWSGRDVSGESN